MSNIEKTVMRRVRSIRYLRMLFSATTASGLLLLLALYGIGREVWVAKVFANSPQGLFSHSLYLAYAFEHTRLTVQALTLVTLASLVYLARETAHYVSDFFIPANA